MTKEGIMIPLKSVIMMIGPSGCGKSFFIKNQLVSQLKNLVPDANIQILSSDGYRREILGKEEKDLSKTDGMMKYASKGAFKLMEAKFDAITTWPIIADFVILDATFIGRQSREQFVEKARNAQYQLVGFLFDFDDREEYFKYIEDPEHKWLISQHLKRFQKELGEIGRRDFDYFYKIKSKDHEIKLEKDQSYDQMKLAKLPLFNSYFVVGDLHGCLKEFKELLNSVGFEIGRDDGDNGNNRNRIKGNDNTLIILTGDVPDRGNEVSELIDFISVNMDRIKICKGGHDRSLVRYIENGKIDDNVKKDKLKHFDSAEKLSPGDLSKFEAIMEGQWYFYVHKHFVATHSPCENKYIGKFDKFSIRKQRSDTYPHHEDYVSEEEYIKDIREHFSYISNDAKKYDPHHIFGHVAVNRPTIVGNKVFLDTGCVYGNKLTGVWISAEYDKIRLKFKSVPSSYSLDSSGPSIIDVDDLDINKGNEIKFESLEFEDKIDILEFAKNKINFISGTMSPCSANRTEKTLEDMREAFSYYRDNGVSNVILQKKYMGSRSNMYLCPKDIDKSYMVSRNGFVIRRLNLKPIYEKMLKFLADRNNIDDCKNNSNLLDSELIIIDGELMPWSALGKSLIESHFTTAGKGVESELQLLEDTCFEHILEDLKKRYDESGYKDLRMEHKKEDLKKIIGESQYRQVRSFGNFRWIPIKEQRDAIDTYNKQIDIYGKEFNEGELDFKPFAILKVVRNDGEELFWNSSNDFVFTAVSDDECLIVSIDDIGLDNARKWFDKVVSEDYEGVVVKPLEKVHTPGIAPYIKVRNPNYLTIIYGYDYIIDPKFTRMIENKNIRNKLRTSIKEFNIGKRLLEIPYNEINENNIKYLDLCAQMVIEEKMEKELDPRL